MDLRHAAKRFAPTALVGLSIAGILGCAALALPEVFQVLAAAERQTPVMFDGGLAALEPEARQGWTNQWCGSCHKQEFEEWSASRHAVSGSTHNFAVEFQEPTGGRQQHCLNCHAPTSPGGELLPTQEPDAIEAAYATPPDWLSNGVDCLTCHVRDGKVLVTRSSAKAEQAHPTRVAPQLGTAEFCAGCHQFGFKSHVLPDGYFGQLQQASFEEFLDFRAAGGTEARCHDCHMAGGGHRMPGGYDAEMLRQAVSLDLKARWLPVWNAVEVSVEVSAGHVGHRIPGGEHFRFLRLETEVRDADGTLVERVGDDAPVPADEDVKSVAAWPQLEDFRRQMGSYERGSDDPDARPLPDTRLWPGEVRSFRYRMPVAAGVKAPLRVVATISYHLMHESKARDFGHDLKTLESVVRQEETTVEIEPGSGR